MFMEIAFFWEESENKPYRHINHVAESAKKEKKREM